MIQRRGWTAIIIASMIVAIVAALFFESRGNPTFRPGDYESYAECVANIPREWAPGSLERTGAEESCGWIHGHPRR